MVPRKKTILFVTPNNARTGATLMLLRFLEWLETQPSADFTPRILMGRVFDEKGNWGVPLQAFGDVLRYPQPQELPPALSKIPGVFKLFKQLRRIILKYRLRQLKPDLVVFHCLHNEEMIKFVSSLNLPALTYCLEHRSRIGNLTDTSVKLLRKQTRLFAAASRASRDLLADRLAVPRESVKVVYPVIRPSDYDYKPLMSRRDICRKLNLPEDTLIVAACGQLTERKGADLFVPLAEAVSRRTERHVSFLWLGGLEQNDAAPEVEKQRRESKAGDCVKFLGTVTDPRDYFAASDVFVLTSREESFGLVCLEAGIFMKPVICFKDAGGPEEFVEDDAGFAVPHLDLNAMAEKTAQLLADEGLRISMGRRAREKVLERHDADRVNGKILKVMRTCLAEREQG